MENAARHAAVAGRLLPVTAALYVGAEALDQGHRPGGHQYGHVFKPLLIARPIVQPYLSGSLSVLASAAWRRRMRRSPCWSPARLVVLTIAALLGGLGAFAGAMLNVLGDQPRGGGPLRT